MKDVKINITSVGFPSQFVSDAEKATDEFDYRLVKPFSMNGLKEMETNAGIITNGETSTS